MAGNKASDVPLPGNRNGNHTTAPHTQPTRSSARRRVSTMKARSCKQLLNAKIEKGVAINKASRQGNAVGSIGEPSVRGIAETQQDVFTVAENNQLAEALCAKDQRVTGSLNPGARTTGGSLKGAHITSGRTKGRHGKDGRRASGRDIGGCRTGGRTSGSRNSGVRNISNRKNNGVAEQEVCTFVSHGEDVVNEVSLSANAKSGSSPDDHSATASDPKHPRRTKQTGRRKSLSEIRAVVPSSATVERNANKSNDETMLGTGNRLIQSTTPAQNHDNDDKSRKESQQGNDIENNAQKKLSKERHVRSILKPSRNADRCHESYLQSHTRDEVDV